MTQYREIFVADGIALSLAREGSGYIKTSAPASPLKARLQSRWKSSRKTIYSFLFGPPDMHGGTKHIVRSEQGRGGYFQLFGDPESGEIYTKLTSAQFQRFVGIWFSANTRRQDGSNRRSLRVMRLSARSNADGSFIMRLGSAMRKMYAAKNEDLESALKSLADPGWTDPVEPETGEKIRLLVDRYLALAYKTMKKAYKTSLKGTGFVHRNGSGHPRLCEILMPNWTTCPTSCRITGLLYPNSELEGVRPGSSTCPAVLFLNSQYEAGSCRK